MEPPLSRPEIIASWNDRYFGGTLPETFRDSLAELPTERQDVVDFLEHFFKLMHHGRFVSTDVSPMQCTVLGSLLSRILPGAWSGRIPPITVGGRHVLIDEYVLRNKWRDATPGLFLDIGCGFPPVTTLDSVAALQGWQVLAADPSMPAHVVYDAEGNYATFDTQGEMVYFQPAAPTVETWNALAEDATATEANFRRLLDRLLPVLGDGAEVTSDGARLVHPMRLYSSASLSFQTAGIGDVQVQDVDVARCFNVLYYLDATFRRRTMQWFEQVLTEGGLLLIGGDWAHTSEARYSVYQKVDGHLVTREFAFSLDNLCPASIVSWFCLVDDDFETLLLADLVRELRSDAAFLQRLNSVNDRLREQHDFAPRGADGFYSEMDPSLGASEIWGRAGAVASDLNEELAEEAVAVLKAGGHEAWVNDLGHVAVMPTGVASQ